MAAGAAGGEDTVGKVGTVGGGASGIVSVEFVDASEGDVTIQNSVHSTVIRTIV